MYASCSGMRIFYYADTIIYSKNAKSSDGREADMNLLSLHWWCRCFLKLQSCLKLHCILL